MSRLEELRSTRIILYSRRSQRHRSDQLSAVIVTRRCLRLRPEANQCDVMGMR